MQENHHRLIYQVDRKYEGMPIKEILKNEYSISTRLFKNIKKHGYILLNGKKTLWHKVAWEGDEILVEMGEEAIDAVPVGIPIDIVYENADVLLINKQPGLVVHPTKGHIDDTLANAVAYHWKNMGISCKIRFVNRLDRDTSGLILIAKNKFAHQNIQKQMNEKKVKKVYWAFVEGVLEKKQGTIEAPIALASHQGIERSVLENGQSSITHYRVIEEYKNASLVELQLETGRTHQIRVHMKYIGHPLLGDSLYNPKSTKAICRQALHAKILGFTLPRDNKYCEFYAPLPNDMEKLQESLIQ
ncbi:RluA family pseudouridine synthase [Garciella nitratireducens]|uniref:RluA family pseudouridine synthase n=1 Tax=Garciella nitratireducens TaxID=218205 RepID=UPI000E02F2E3|nr:RluA family pseudouridine synthase [Garciella nitratireducens]RBP40260.1 23S rRNA pseudouridine1911/1915/1917 synthase [Garciella nitratireducens]